MPSRVRERGSLSNSSKYVTTTFGGTVSTTEPYGTNRYQEGELQITTDVVTPKFRTRIARGEIINNPFSSFTQTWVNSYTRHVIRKNTGSGSTIKTYDWSHGYNGNTSFPTDWWLDISSALEEASTEAAAKVGETSVDGATELGEARQTMQLFDRHQYNLRMEIEKELRYARKRGAKFPTSVPIAVLSNNWLKYRYGIMPFVRLMNDALVVGSRIRTQREIKRGASVIGGDTEYTTSVETGAFHVVTSTRSKTWEASTRAGILYEYRDFGNKYGFTLADVPPALWELTPWSFVVDWFANTGTFIRALTPRYNIVRRATWLGYETKLDWHITHSLGAIRVSGYTVDAQGSGSSSLRILGRKRVPHILSPTWSTRESALTEIITSKKIVDAFALTSQLFFRLMRRS